MAKPNTFVFRADASPQLGGGHIMRCLTLADALRAEGHRSVFVTRGESCTTVPLLAQSGHDVVTVEASEQAICQEMKARGLRASWAVVDSYAMDVDDEAAWRAIAPRILVIDERLSRPHDCDLLLDTTFGRTGCDYEGWLPPSARVLAGSSFALVRPAFAAMRERVLLRRASETPSQPRILVSLGLTDVGAMTGAVVAALLDAGWTTAIDCVISSAAPSLSRLRAMAREYPQLMLYVDVTDMAPLMAAADLAIGGAGQTSFERCVLGLPALVLVMADNQQEAARALAAHGAARIVTLETLVEQAREVLSSPAAQVDMPYAASLMADGLGVQRVVRQLLQPLVTVRKALPGDAEMILAWRNDPETRRQSRETEPVSHESHATWFETRLNDPDTLLVIAEVDATPCGVVRFIRHRVQSADVSVNLAPGMRRRGIGPQVLSQAIGLAAAQRFAANATAEIREGNAASLKLVAQCNFRQVSRAGGWVRVERSLEGPRQLLSHH